MIDQGIPAWTSDTYGFSGWCLLMLCQCMRLFDAHVSSFWVWNEHVMGKVGLQKARFEARLGVRKRASVGDGWHVTFAYISITYLVFCLSQGFSQGFTQGFSQGFTQGFSRGPLAWLQSRIRSAREKCSSAKCRFSASCHVCKNVQQRLFRLFGATCSFSASCHDRKNVEQRSFRFLVPNVVSVQVVMTAKMLSRDQERT